MRSDGDCLGAQRSRNFIKGLFCFSWGLIAMAMPAAAENDQVAEHLSQPQEVIIQPAVYWRSDGLCGGGTQRVQVETEPNPTGGVQVGFFESNAGAIGDQMNASGWLSALISADLAESDLRDYRVSYSWSGPIDGPSAGGLMTSALLSMLLGDIFPGDATMTGTINPDGTIGPVGGITFKLEGVAEAGIKRFAIPLGDREDYDECADAWVDVVEKGRGLGVDVVEVGDIYEAYAFLTGARLPRPEAPPQDRQLPDDLRAGYDALFGQWLARYGAAEAVVSAAEPRDFTKELRVFWNDGARFLAAAESERQAGRAPAAFNRVWMAVLNAEFVARGVTALREARSFGFPGLHLVTAQVLADAEKQANEGLALMRAIKIASLTDAGTVANIGALLATAFAYLEEAKAGLASAQEMSREAKPQDFVDVGKRYFEALGQATLVGPVMDLALAARGWLGRGKVAWQRSAEDVNFGRELYGAAAQSNLRYVDSLHTAVVAKRRRLDMASAQAEVKREDPIYLAAAGSLAQQGRIFNAFEDDFTAAVAQMGVLMGSLSNSAVLVAKYYSIRAEIDELGRVTGLYNEPALTRMMALAEEATLRAIGEADAVTQGAATQMLHSGLDVARRNRDAAVTTQDLLTALGYFWGTTMNARLIVKLGRV